MKAPKSLNTKLSEIQADFGVGLEFAGLIYPDSSSSAAIIPAEDIRLNLKPLNPKPYQG